MENLTEPEAKFVDNASFVVNSLWSEEGWLNCRLLQTGSRPNRSRQPANLKRRSYGSRESSFRVCDPCVRDLRRGNDPRLEKNPNPEGFQLPDQLPEDVEQDNEMENLSQQMSQIGSQRFSQQSPIQENIYDGRSDQSEE